jgi:hypothetical protein
LAAFFIGYQSERLCTCAAGPNVTQLLHGSFCLFQLAVNGFSRATDTNWESHRVAIEWSNSEGRRQAENRIEMTTIQTVCLAAFTLAAPFCHIAFGQETAPNDPEEPKTTYPIEHLVVIFRRTSRSIIILRPIRWPQIRLENHLSWQSLVPLRLMGSLLTFSPEIKTHCCRSGLIVRITQQRIRTTIIRMNRRPWIMV